MAKENKQPEQNEALRGILDPIAPEDLTEHWQSISGWLDPMRDLNPEYLANMDYNKQISGGNQSFNQYWDDSSPEMQWTLGWTNQKYTWEYTKNSDINYDANITTKDLNPNFVYWKASQVYGTDHPWYISQRNDQIASALFNEWKVSKEEVQAFLESQNWFFNSSEADRANTVESIWKRLWQLSEQNKPEEEWPDLSKAEEIQKDTSGKIYWKTTAEEWNPKEWIDTLADKNSVYAAMEAWRVSNLKALVVMDSEDIATSIKNWIIPYGSQAYRDLQQYYPEKYKEVQDALKKKNWQDAVNAISTWWTNYTSDEIESKNKTLETSKTEMAQSVSSSKEQTSDVVKEIDNSLSNNWAANSAEQTMANITDEINKLNTRLKNLDKEASSAFKWDVPDYLVRAYINNKTQEINDRLKELKYDYNAAYERYQTELSNTWKEKEFDLKERQLDMQEKQQDFNQWYQKQTLAKSNIYKDDDGNVWQLKTGEDWNIYYEKITQVQQYSNSWMKWKWLKNNNPWNIKDDNFWNVVGHDDSWFAIFASPEDWFDALVEKIIFNQTNPNSRYYWTTIREYFKIYAPSSDWNNPDAYAKSVAKQLWVSIDTPISQLDPVKFASVIAKHDSGYDYSTYWQFRTNQWDSNQITDTSNVEVPDSVYTIDIWERTDWSKITRKVDPNSEEWKQLREKYLESMWYNSTGWLSAREDLWGTSWAAYQVISSDWVTPISFRQRLYNLIPATLKNSDTELKNLYEIAKELYVKWYNADEASMVFYWLDPRNDKTWLLRPLISIARASGTKLSDDFYWRLWSLLEYWSSWNEEDMKKAKKQAILLIENSVLSDKEKAAENNAISIVSKIQRLETLLQNADKYTGILDKKLNTAIKDMYWNEKYAQLAADIQNIYGQIRNELMWANVTEWEIELYTDMFPDMSDKVSTIMQKLKSTKNAYIQDVNSVRLRYDLPKVNQYTLVDYNLRADLYSANI